MTFIERVQKIKQYYFGHISRSQFYLGMVLSSLFINILALVFPLALLQMYDRIIPNNAYDTLLMLLMIVISAMLFEMVLKIARAAISAWCSARLEYRLSKKSFEKMLQTSQVEFDQEGAGEHLEKMNALQTVKEFWGGQTIANALDFPFVILYLAFIAVIGGWLVLAPVLVISLYAGLAFTLGRSMRKTLEARRAADERRLNFIIETLTGIHTVKSMSMEPLIQRRYERLNRGAAKWDSELSYQSTLTASSSSLLSNMNMILIVCFGCGMVVNGDLTVGGMAACTLLANRALNPMGIALSTWQRLHAVRLAQSRLNSLFQLESEFKHGSVEAKQIQGEIEFRDLHYQSDKHQSPLFHHLNMKIKAGEAVSIVGTGQSGRSNLLMLIMGIIKPNQGKVMIDGIDIADYDLQQLRKQIAYLPQQGSLFEGSIIDNISLFRQGKYQQKAMEAAHLLGLDKEIYKLPQGFDTKIGNHTIDYLPIGLRQRICIARALVNEPKIVLFDEANSAVDHAADEKLLALLNHLKQHCTLIIISHRPSTLAIADRSYRLQDGALIADKEAPDEQQSLSA